MNSVKEILGKCFNSKSNLWIQYLSEKQDSKVLYYPSAAEDLRPLLFSLVKCLEYTNLNTKKEHYIEPDLFIFSDYFPYPESNFFDSKFLYKDCYTSLYLDDFCELTPDSEHYNYLLEKHYVHFPQSKATGKAVFFKVKIDSHIMPDEAIFKYGIYFFYENVNLISELLLRHSLPVSHIVWKRDGSAFGGGNVRLDFIFPLSEILGIKYFFLWDHYLDLGIARISEREIQETRIPKMIRKLIKTPFNIKLVKKKRLRWGGERVNLYIKED
jgi:hypothetical protein